MKMMSYIHKLVIATALLAISVVHAYVVDSDDALCKSEIYCSGDVLHTIQMAKIYNDSKTFVDKKLKQSPQETVQRFHEFMAEHDDNPSRDDINQFVQINFEDGNEFHNWVPDDWTETPPFIDNIKDEIYKDFAKNLTKIWKILGKKMKDEVAENSELYSIIYVKNGIIVPGGRFLEFYYWDTFWIIRGLLQSQMFETVRGMLRNFFSMIDRYGFIPNGGRIYYLTRTQPPMLTSMVKSYIDFTNDEDFMSEALPRLEAEFDYFEQNRMQKVNDYELYTYGSPTANGARPESYREDYNMSQRYFKTDEERRYFYMNIIAAAESGMDFSSRWFINNGTNNGKLYNVQTRSIVPVELNAMIYFNAKTIAEFNNKLGNTDNAEKYLDKAQKLFEAVQAVLWNDEYGIWFDYDILDQKQRPYFAATNLSPLVFECYNTTDKPAVARKVLDYINRKDTDIDRFPGGIPTTLMGTGEQWDYPNAWAPLQHWVCEGLRTLDDQTATDLAHKWTKRWILSNFIAFKESNYTAMYEKYMADTLGGHGGGGEYEIQVGFGWTNGVIIDYLAKYGDNITAFS